MKRLILAVAVLVGVAALPTSAAADIIIGTAPNFVQPEENLLFNQPGLNRQGLIVQGVTNVTGEIFHIEGLESLSTPANGQARVVGTDDGFKSALIYALDPLIVFTEFEANLRFTAQSVGFATVVATNSDGDSESLTFAIGNGENYFGILAFNLQFLTDVLITTDVDLMDIRQIRLGGVQELRTPDPDPDPEPVPEPASILLLGLGLLGARVLVRRAKK